MRGIIISFFFILGINGQSLDTNNDFFYNEFRISSLNGNQLDDYSLNIRPISTETLFSDLYKTILSNKKETLLIKNLGLDYFVEYNSNHPYNRNNGTMIPNRGYQHIISPGLFLKLVIIL